MKTRQTGEESQAAQREPAASAAHTPQVSPWLLRGFNWYVPRYLCRNFNAVRIAKPGLPQLTADEPLVCFANHPSWWDPMLAFLLNELCMPGRTVYAPIDQQALKQYPFFANLGFYGIELGELEGAKRFLSVTRAILSRREAAVWMTPSGRFQDVRSHSQFQPGLGHIASRAGQVTFLPVALEYTFWEERTPEALVEFGVPIRAGEEAKSKDEWQVDLEARLARAQASLAEKSIARDSDQFEVVLEGSAGIGGWYDFWRRIKSGLTGQAFNPRHGRGPTMKDRHD